jgi:hypothetical protein
MLIGESALPLSKSSLSAPGLCVSSVVLVASSDLVEVGGVVFVLIDADQD